MAKNTSTAGCNENNKKTSAKETGTVLEKAKAFATKEFARLGEKGKFFLSHSERIATTLVEQGFDNTTAVAAMLHDTFVHAGTPREKISSAFGEETALIVEEYAKIREIEERNIGKISPKLLSQIILATAKDIRAIFLMVATEFDRLTKPFDTPHNELLVKAQIALDVYAPICHKLGLYEIGADLEDACLKLLQPVTYEKIASLVGKSREEMKAAAQQAAKELSILMKDEGIKATVYSRAKNFFAINKKMSEQNRPFNDIFDLLGARIICDTIRECYEALGVMHSKYTVIPARFTDYIANPKENNYRSIHTVVEWHDGMPLEVQIRTWEMHYESETGLAAHWQYKKYAEDKLFDKKLSWANQLVQWQRMTPNSEGFIQSLQLDFGKNRIFTFTPKQDVIMLPEKSTPIDFAFAVHSELGYRCKQARVNGKIVPLETKLQNGDMVEIITSKKPETKRQWLFFVKSSKAIAKIKQQLGVVFSKEAREKKPTTTLTTSDKKIRIANCCNPLPGEEIIGIRTTKRKISVHRAECKNVARMKKDKIVAVTWDTLNATYTVEIKVTAKDSPTLLPSILNAISEKKVVINRTDAKVNPNNTTICFFKIQINSTKQFEELMTKIRTLPGVFSAERA